MHLNISNPDSTTTKLVIRADKAELEKAKRSALKRLATQVKVPGFREGKVPPAVVEKSIDSSVLQSEVLESVINNLYMTAVRQEKLRPVTNPEVSIKKFVPFTDLEFEASVPTVNKISLADYKKIKLVKKPIKITEEDVKNVIKSLQTRAANRTEVKRAAKPADEVTLDFKGTDAKGNDVAGADAKEYPLVLGSNSFIPGFEEEIVGLKSGDEKTFKITFPKDYGVKALQGQKVTFAVKIHKVSEVAEPKVDNDFAAAVGPFKSVKELKDDIKKQLQLEKDRETDTQYENELLEKIAEKSDIEVPKLLVDEQIDRIEQEEKQSIIYRGQTWEEHLKEEGVTADEHREQKRPAAEQRVKIGIILSEVGEIENITATPEEVEVRLQLMKGQYQDPASQAELNKPEAVRDIETRIRTEKVLAKLKEYASK